MTGFGAVFLTPSGAEYFAGKWTDYGIDPKALGFHISELEMLVVTCVGATWGHLLSTKRVLMRCDNESCVQTLQRGRCRDPGMMCCVRELCLAMAKHSFDMMAHHIRTEENVLADAASRDDWERFFSYALSEFGLTTLKRIEPKIDLALMLRRIRDARAAARS